MGMNLEALISGYAPTVRENASYAPDEEIVLTGNASDFSPKRRPNE
jgi:hypothetical protein